MSAVYDATIQAISSYGVTVTVPNSRSNNICELALVASYSAGAKAHLNKSQVRALIHSLQAAFVMMEDN